MKKEILIRNKNFKADIKVDNINYVDIKDDSVYFNSVGDKDYLINLSKKELVMLKDQLESLKEFVQIDNKFLNVSKIVSAEMLQTEKSIMSVSFKNQTLEIPGASANDFNALTQGLEAQESFMF